MGRHKGTRTLFSGLLALICFIAVTPTALEMPVDVWKLLVKDGLAKQFQDTQNLFLGMFIAF